MKPSPPVQTQNIASPAKRGVSNHRALEIALEALRHRRASIVHTDSHNEPCTLYAENFKEFTAAIERIEDMILVTEMNIPFNHTEEVNRLIQQALDGIMKDLEIKNA
jgi:hypothetical protein